MAVCGRKSVAPVTAPPLLEKFMEDFWQTCSALLERELTPQQYSAWIKPLAPLDFEDGRLRIAAPNRFTLDWVKSQFSGRITALACEYWEAQVSVHFVLDPAASGRAAAYAQPPAGGMGGQPGMMPGARSSIRSTARPSARKGPIAHSGRASG